MTARIATIRFLDNNIAIRDITTYISYSSALAAGPFSNCQIDIRSKAWIPSGNFTIDDTNNKIYINDGSNKTVTLTNANYATPVLLAAHIQTQLNASSSNWTCTYSSTTYKFTIGHTGSATLRLTQTTAAVWDTLGYTTGSDLTGTSFVADQQRNHTDEYAIWDFTAARDILAFACIGPVNEVFGLSSSATITLEANNINDWSAPPFSETLTRTDNGVFDFFDDLTAYAYRYVRLRYIDRTNTLGPSGVKLSHIYIGDYTTLSNNRTVSHGYDKRLVDPSSISASDSGTLYADTKVKFSEFNGIGLEILERDQKDDLEYLFKQFGKTSAFYVSIDPLNQYTDSLDELTKFVYFKDEPSFKHIVKDYFSTVINLREVV